MITYEYLKSILEYNPNTGDWTWLIDRGKKIKKGQKAGSKMKNNYWQIHINKKNYYSHILAWFYITKKWPEKDIDHKNTIRNDNRWENLREASQSQNSGNQKISINNTSGYKGVTWRKNIKKWNAQIIKNKKKFHLGYYSCPIEAAKTYDKKAIELHGEFAKVNFA